MEILGWYYLHTNGDLIYKHGSDSIADIRDSNFSISAWPFMQDREQAWSIVIEAACLDARKGRIDKLIEDWGLNDHDAEMYAESIGLILGIDGNKKTAVKKNNFSNLMESHAGFGDTYFDAMVDLCKKLGYKGGKMWNATFKVLVKG